MPILSGTSRETKGYIQNNEINSSYPMRYDDSIISIDETHNTNQILIYPEEESSELIENKFRYTYKGISK